MQKRMAGRMAALRRRSRRRTCKTQRSWRSIAAQQPARPAAPLSCCGVFGAAEAVRLRLLFRRRCLELGRGGVLRLYRLLAPWFDSTNDSTGPITITGNASKRATVEVEVPPSPAQPPTPSRSPQLPLATTAQRANAPSPRSPRAARTASPTDAPVFGQLRIAQHLVPERKALLSPRLASEELRLVEQELACLQAGIAQARAVKQVRRAAAGPSCSASMQCWARCQRATSGKTNSASLRAHRLAQSELRKGWFAAECIHRASQNLPFALLLLLTATNLVITKRPAIPTKTARFDAPSRRSA